MLPPYAYGTARGRGGQEHTTSAPVRAHICDARARTRVLVRVRVLLQPRLTARKQAVDRGRVRLRGANRAVRKSLAAAHGGTSTARAACGTHHVTVLLELVANARELQGEVRERDVGRRSAVKSAARTPRARSCIRTSPRKMSRCTHQLSTVRRLCLRRGRVRRARVRPLRLRKHMHASARTAARKEHPAAAYCTARDEARCRGTAQPQAQVQAPAAQARGACLYSRVARCACAATGADMAQAALRPLTAQSATGRSKVVN